MLHFILARCPAVSAVGGCDPVQWHASSWDSSGGAPGRGRAHPGHTEHRLPGRKHAGGTACFLFIHLLVPICMELSGEYIIVPCAHIIQCVHTKYINMHSLNTYYSLLPLTVANLYFLCNSNNFVQIQTWNEFTNTQFGSSYGWETTEGSWPGFCLCNSWWLTGHLHPEGWWKTNTYLSPKKCTIKNDTQYSLQKQETNKVGNAEVGGGQSTSASSCCAQQVHLKQHDHTATPRALKGSLNIQRMLNLLYIERYDSASFYLIETLWYTVSLQRPVKNLLT